MALLRNRSLLAIGISESVSGIGNWITMLAVFAIVIFRGDGNVAQSSGIFLAGLLPTLLASPAAGWLCDRYDRKWLMIASELLAGLAVSGLIFARRLELIYALLAVQATVMALMAPARQAVVPHLVASDELTRANALLQQLSGLVKTGGPVLAGLVLAVLDPHQAIILDVVSFGLSALILSRLPALPPTASRQAQGARPNSARPNGTRVDRVSGLQVPSGALAMLRGSAALRLLFTAVFGTIVVIVGFDVLSAVVTRDILRGNEALLGLFIGLVGVGTTAAALALLLRSGRRNAWPDLVAGLGLLACLPAAAALAAQLPSPLAARLVIGAGCLAGGVGNGLVNIQAGTLLQQLAPAELLGRLGGLFQSTATAGQLIGIVATPLIVPGLLPAGSYFAAATVLLALLIGYVMLALRQKAPSLAASEKPC